MFGDLNRVELIGNITNDIQVRYTANGSAVTSFGVATNRRYKAPDGDDWKEETNFHNIVVWGNQAEQLAQRARKGTRIFVAGRLQTRSWDDAEGKKNYKTEVVAENLILLDRYERGAGAGQSQDDSSAPTQKPEAKAAPVKSQPKPVKKKDDSVIDPDDLPF